MKKLAIVTTHPIQYNAPLFRLLEERGRLCVDVFYTWEQSQKQVYDSRFGIERSWDVPLLEGYRFRFVQNSARKPDSNRFLGVVNPGLLHELRTGGYDAVLIYRWSLWSHLNLLQLLGGNHGPRLLFRGDSHLSGTKQGWKKKLKLLLLRQVYRKVHTALYVGAHNRAYYQACGLNDQQLIYAPHAVDNARFSLNAAALEAQALSERESLGIPSDAFVFLYAGKFYSIKEIDLLIQCFKQLEGTHYRLLLLGGGEQMAELQKAAAPDNRILFLPFRNQSGMPVAYRLGDVFVLPSRSETWGLSVNEAMACSRPVLVSDGCGCVPELVLDGETGYAFKQGSAEDLLKKMRNFGTGSMAKKMGKKAFAHVTQFSFDRVAEAIEHVVLQQE